MQNEQTTEDVQDGHSSSDMEVVVDDLLDDDAIAVAEKPQFRIDSQESANWVIRRIKDWRAYRDRLDSWYELEVRRSERNEAFLLGRFGDQLRCWAAKTIAAVGGKTKSLNLPSARIGFKTVPARLVIDDEIAVLAWAKQHCPEAIVTVVRLSRTPITSRFKETGEVPDKGAHIQESHEAFHIT
jgi:hypothetical protein